VIGFDPFDLLMSTNDAFELRQKRAIGTAGRFAAKPAFIVGARQFASRGIHSDFRVDLDSASDRDTLEITWDCPKGPVDHQEISFMVVGEVPATPKERATRASKRGSSTGKGKKKR
jgi:hypothetical protein